MGILLQTQRRDSTRIIVNASRHQDSSIHHRAGWVFDGEASHLTRSDVAVFKRQESIGDRVQVAVECTANNLALSGVGGIRPAHKNIVILVRTDIDAIGNRSESIADKGLFDCLAGLCVDLGEVYTRVRSIVCIDSLARDINEVAGDMGIDSAATTAIVNDRSVHAIGGRKGIGIGCTAQGAVPCSQRISTVIKEVDAV